MCIGLPVQVLKCKPGYALCRRSDDSLVEINTLLIEPPKTGDWLLTFLDSAREIIDAGQARLIIDALQALQYAARGEQHDALFADLINREPTLPEFLQPKDHQENP